LVSTEVPSDPFVEIRRNHRDWKSGIALQVEVSIASAQAIFQRLSTILAE
jgi:hypothetical protein